MVALGYNVSLIKYNKKAETHQGYARQGVSHNEPGLHNLYLLSLSYAACSSTVRTTDGALSSDGARSK